jgi:hypothetical protein
MISNVKHFTVPDGSVFGLLLLLYLRLTGTPTAAEKVVS